MSEIIDLRTIIEIHKIRELLLNHPDLLSMFELLVIVSNKRINEKGILNKKFIPAEKNIVITEIHHIKKLLIKSGCLDDHPDILSMFDILVIIANNKLNYDEY
jgi:hypothetical protein